jgi:hypothetical protein
MKSRGMPRMNALLFTMPKTGHVSSAKNSTLVKTENANRFLIMPFKMVCGKRFKR